MSTRKSKKEKSKDKAYSSLKSFYEDLSLKKDVVKREFKYVPKHTKAEPSGKKNTKISDKREILPNIKRDIVKSVTLASLILSLELMLYLAWK